MNSVQFSPHYSAEELKIDFDLTLCYLATENKFDMSALQKISQILTEMIVSAKVP
jgi:hypothetical protein